MKLGTETGSVVNHLKSRATVGQPTPAVGMGATILLWSDRHPATIIKVTPKTVTVQEDTAERVDDRGPYTEEQEYRFSPNPNGATAVFRLTARGWRQSGGKGAGLMIGHREKFCDPHF